MTFRFNARYGLLTYAQCGDLDAFKVSNALSALGAECIVARESHSDGGTHLHAFFDFGRKRDFRNQAVFDVDDFHPNISVSRGTPWDGYDYATKEGDIVAGGLERPEPPTPASSKRHDKWVEIVAAPTRTEFFERVRALDPERLVTCFTQLQKYADHEYTTEPEPYRTPTNIGFNTEDYPGLEQWKAQLSGADSHLGKQAASTPQLSRTGPTGGRGIDKADPCRQISIPCVMGRNENWKDTLGQITWRAFILLRII